MTEARVSREALRLALPPSRWSRGAGDVIELPGDGGESVGRYRIDRVEQTDIQIVDAVRIEPEVYDLADITEEPVAVRPFVVPLPVQAHSLDLPLIRGDEVPHAPYVTAAADPWPGAVAVYQSSTDENYGLNSILSAPSTVGVTQSVMASASAGLYDRGPALEVRLSYGTLEAISEEALLSGANLAAIGNGTTDDWELFQFAKADLVSEKTYRLTQRLRGQAGSDGLMPQEWPVGSVFVLIDSGLKQIEFSPNLRRLVQHFRIGSAQRSVDDASYRHCEKTFEGNGLRPYRPAHLRIGQWVGSEIVFEWVRRTRIDGDNWELPDVPLSEEREQYVVRVRAGGALLREEVIDQPAWTYTQAQRLIDGALGTFDIAVAQVSASYGAGLAAVLRVDT